MWFLYICILLRFSALATYWNLPPDEKVSRRKHPACKRATMDCSLMDNTHWKTPPYWTSKNHQSRDSRNYLENYQLFQCYNAFFIIEKKLPISRRILLVLFFSFVKVSLDLSIPFSLSKLLFPQKITLLTGISSSIYFFYSPTQVIHD